MGSEALAGFEATGARYRRRRQRLEARALTAMACALVAACGGDGASTLAGSAPSLSRLSWNPVAAYSIEGQVDTTISATVAFAGLSGPTATLTLVVTDVGGRLVGSSSRTVSARNPGALRIGTFLVDADGRQSNGLAGEVRVVDYPWVARAPMPTPRTETLAVAAGGQIYVLGGLRGTSLS